tara:strand:+ start:4519 stop:4908 length:390 start_codon:yes stop_codon:yes gene_type:complete
MNKYYHEFVKQRLKKDIMNELIKEGFPRIIVVKEINLYFKNEIQFNEIKRSMGTHQIRDRGAYKDRKDRCKARVWNEGEGGQCSCSGRYDGFCMTHLKKGGEQWFLGTIDKPKPERPILPNGEILSWND